MPIDRHLTAVNEPWRKPLTPVERAIWEAEARHFQKTMNLERYWTDERGLCRQRPDKPFVERYVNAIWNQIS